MHYFALALTLCLVLVPIVAGGPNMSLSGVRWNDVRKAPHHHAEVEVGTICAVIFTARVWKANSKGTDMPLESDEDPCISFHAQRVLPLYKINDAVDGEQADAHTTVQIPVNNISGEDMDADNDMFTSGPVNPGSDIEEYAV